MTSTAPFHDPRDNGERGDDPSSYGTAHSHHTNRDYPAHHDDDDTVHILIHGDPCTRTRWLTGPDDKNLKRPFWRRRPCSALVLILGTMAAVAVLTVLGISHFNPSPDVYVAQCDAIDYSFEGLYKLSSYRQGQVNVAWLPAVTTFAGPSYLIASYTLYYLRTDRTDLTPIEVISNPAAVPHTFVNAHTATLTIETPGVEYAFAIKATMTSVFSLLSNHDDAADSTHNTQTQIPGDGVLYCRIAQADPVRGDVMLRELTFAHNPVTFDESNGILQFMASAESSPFTPEIDDLLTGKPSGGGRGFLVRARRVQYDEASRYYTIFTTSASLTDVYEHLEFHGSARFQRYDDAIMTEVIGDFARPHGAFHPTEQQHESDLRHLSERSFTVTSGGTTITSDLLLGLDVSAHVLIERFWIREFRVISDIGLRNRLGTHLGSMSLSHTWQRQLYHNQWIVPLCAVGGIPIELIVSPSVTATITLSAGKEEVSGHAQGEVAYSLRSGASFPPWTTTLEHKHTTHHNVSNVSVSQLGVGTKVVARLMGDVDVNFCFVGGVVLSLVPQTSVMIGASGTAAYLAHAHLVPRLHVNAFNLIAGIELDVTPYIMGHPILSRKLWSLDKPLLTLPSIVAEQAASACSEGSFNRVLVFNAYATPGAGFGDFTVSWSLDRGPLQKEIFVERDRDDRIARISVPNTVTSLTGVTLYALVLSDKLPSSFRQYASVFPKLAPIHPDACCSDAACGSSQLCDVGNCVSRGVPRFSLYWTSQDDLDLHVVSPNGHEIFGPSNVTSPDGGHLDRDRIPTSAGTWVENIFWPQDHGSAPQGQYTYFVRNKHALTGSDWVLRVYMGTTLQDTQMGYLQKTAESSERFHFKI